jgi:sec-independent protein translocase protein TatA
MVAKAGRVGARRGPADVNFPGIPCAPLETRYDRSMPGWIGLPELIVLLVVLLLIFGPKRLPEMGRSLGKGMREFKDSISGKGDDDDEPVALPRESETTSVGASAREHDTV